VHYDARPDASLAGLIFRSYANGSHCEEPENKSVPAVPFLSAGAGFSLITPDTNQLRQYFIGSYGSVLESSYNYDMGGWRASRVIAADVKVHNATPVVAAIEKDSVWVLWSSKHKELQYTSSVWTASTWTKGKTPPPSPMLVQRQATHDSHTTSGDDTSTHTQGTFPVPWSRSLG